MNARIATDTELIEFNGWTLRVRHSGKPRRLLLLVHGFTGDENSMWVFTRGVSSHYMIVAPRAPFAADPSGYSWRSSQPDLTIKPAMQMFRESVDGLIRLVDEYQAFVKMEAPTFDVLGFSQGAAMSSLLMLMYPQRVHRAGILAGFVPEEVEELTASLPLAGKQVLMAHGTQDQTITIERARQSAALLERAGASVIFCEDEVGHKLGANGLRALDAYLKT